MKEIKMSFDEYQESQEEFGKDFNISVQKGGSLFPIEQIKNRQKELSLIAEKELKSLRGKWEIEIQNLLKNGTPTEYLNDELIKEIYNYGNENI